MDVTEHFRDSLPLDAVLFVNSEVLNDKIAHLNSEVITLTQLAVRSSIVATTSANESGEIPEIDDYTITASVPTDLKIYVSVLGGQLKDDPVYEDPPQLYDNCNLSRGEGSTEGYSELRVSVTSGSSHYKNVGVIASHLSKQLLPSSANLNGKPRLVIIMYDLVPQIVYTHGNIFFFFLLSDS